VIDLFAADAELRALLARTRTIAVVGLSPDLQRPSHGVASYLQAHGFRIVPVNPNAAEVLGEKAFPTLAEAASQVDIDLVDVFRRSEDVPPVMQQAIEIGAAAVWLQLGIRHDAAKALGEAAGLVVVQDCCLMVEHRRLA
jgi:predicted CoA-binding protein